MFHGKDNIMDKIINEHDTFIGGSFITNENQMAFAPFKESSELFLTQVNNEGIKRQILKLIDQSKYVLKICSFIITDKDIFNALMEKAKSHKVAIFILTQLDDSKLQNTSDLSSFITEEELKENPASTHMYFIKTLYDNGVHVRAATTAHAKFIIADRNNAFITSANLTTPSMVQNTESGVYLARPYAENLDLLFDVIFQHGTKYIRFTSAGKRKNFVGQANISILPEQLPKTEKCLLRFTYEQLTHNLYREILDIIDSAEKYIYLSTYSIVGLEKIPEFRSAIVRAIDRQVEIYVFCRGMNYRTDHLEGTEVLRSAGCKIYADIFNHSKGIINEKTGMIFTANIDGNHGLINGFEVGCLLSDKQRATFLEFNKYLMEISDYVYLPTPTRRMLFDTFSRYEKKKEIMPPKFPEQLSISIAPGLSIKGSALADSPILYGHHKDHKFLIIGNKLFKCHYDQGHFHLLGKEKMRYDIEKYILKYVNLKIQQN